LPYVFDSLDHADRPWSAQDRKLAETMSAYWVNFIKTGNPNGKGLPDWPAVDVSHATTMELGDKMAPRPIVDSAKLALFEPGR
jgi:para-nitrobenzyl esterase